jgi:serine/threonine protein kinase
MTLVKDAAHLPTKECARAFKMNSTSKPCNGDSRQLPDGYTFLRCIGMGGFGEVVVATKNSTKYALKLLKEGKLTEIDRLRIMTEAEILKHSRHKNIVQLYDVILSPPCLVFEYCESGNLWQQAVKQSRESVAPFLVKTGVEICSALVMVHEKQIVHGDIKPENILYTGSGKDLVAKLSDFGVARVFGSLLKAATTEYLPPEYPIGFQANPRLDLYQLGLSLYFALVVSVQKRRGMSYLQKLKRCPQALSSEYQYIPSDFEQVLLKAINVCTTDFGGSYDSAKEFLTDLKNCKFV